MTTTLTQRLNQILPRITSEAFLSSEGIGNEIAFYIFDYPAEEELTVREHIKMLTSRLETYHSDLSFLHLNLLDVTLAYLQQRRLFDKALKMEANKGTAAVLHALEGPMAAEKISKFITKTYKPAEYDLVLVSGVGSVWPILRAHSLLSSLHKDMGKTPMVMFYPGTFDGRTLRLFGRIASTTSNPAKKPYYRAFELIPGEKA